MPLTCHNLSSEFVEIVRVSPKSPADQGAAHPNTEQSEASWEGPGES